MELHIHTHPQTGITLEKVPICDTGRKRDEDIYQDTHLFRFLISFICRPNYSSAAASLTTAVHTQTKFVPRK